eukprot:COSAG01_NODE_65040_length_274_cov_0.891429_1_plen_83_part_10
MRVSAYACAYSYMDVVSMYVCMTLCVRMPPMGVPRARLSMVFLFRVPATAPLRSVTELGMEAQLRQRAQQLPAAAAPQYFLTR